jgi:hypothetical protein
MAIAVDDPKRVRRGGDDAQEGLAVDRYRDR